jgi:hypothetical protein
VRGERRSARAEQHQVGKVSVEQHAARAASGFARDGLVPERDRVRVATGALDGVDGLAREPSAPLIVLWLHGHQQSSLGASQ